MGRALVEAGGSGAAGLQIGALLEHAGSALVGADGARRLAARAGVTLQSDPAARDWRLPGVHRFHAAGRHARALAACRSAKVNMVIGTTGFDEVGNAIADAANDIAIVFAANMSIGVNVATELVRTRCTRAACGLRHRSAGSAPQQKVDAPSGTALMLGEAAARGTGKPLGELAVYDRHGVTGERKRGSIGFASLRAGDIVGDHTVFCRAGRTHRDSTCGDLPFEFCRMEQ